ncbi:hypothetical protein EYR41_002284 [Orbilia oligospora]|uniref:Uncharacterized protein n=1 Tax=Orbilia oligospora TaxID=2813651 RepID=A0A7C8KFK2_ORBOL|nr:hypothetical protein TWF751_006620 [Orbilia oligospora]TGJ62305.1 hypothetical protein EYR41_002284 [Orbilia oligospora]
MAGAADVVSPLLESITKSTQSEEGLGLFCLPREIRQQIYEEIITYASNFTYRSTAQFKEARDDHKIIHMKRKNKRLRELQRKDGVCGITFGVAPFPKFVDGGYDTINLLLVSKTFSADIKSAAGHIRRKINSTVSKCLTGPNSYSQFWSGDHLTPYALEVIGSGRHIFAGYGHNTTTTALSMPPKVRDNIKSIFLTAFVFSYYYTRNWGTSGAGSSQTFTSFFPPVFKQFINSFPNCEILAAACGIHGSRSQIPTRDHYILQYIKNAFHGQVLLKSNLKFMELVYRQEEDLDYRTNSTSQWSIDVWDGYIGDYNAVQVPELELEGRGRYWAEYEHISDEFRDLLVEGTVWRIQKEKDPLSGRSQAIPISDFEDPFIDLCADEIFDGDDVIEAEAQREPIMWEERCWGKACDCGNNCDIYTAQKSITRKSTCTTT